MKRNRNRLVDDFSERRVRSNHLDRRASQHHFSRHNHAGYLQRQKTVDDSSHKSLPRLVNQNSQLQTPISVMQTLTRSEPVHNGKEQNKGGVPRNVGMINVENFHPDKRNSCERDKLPARGESLEKHYKQYLNQWAPRHRSGNRNML